MKIEEEILARLLAIEERLDELENRNPVLPLPSEQIDTLARTLWGEARGEGRRGMEAVAAVIMNRVRDPRRWPNDAASVSRQPWQFSAWNAGDPNRALLMAVTEEDREFRQALDIATAALRGELTDPTNGANHFHTNAVSPSWSRGVTPVASIGGHRFFRL
jgi:spore germination cell wall hydrolase CwlJ-like protein